MKQKNLIFNITFLGVRIMATKKKTTKGKKSNKVKKAELTTYKNDSVLGKGTRKIFGTVDGREYEATLYLKDFSVKFKNKTYKSVSGAANRSGIIKTEGRQVNGWDFWMVGIGGGEYDTLNNVFKRKKSKKVS